MAKKSFKENPALSFISQALQTEEPVRKAPPENTKAYESPYTHTTTDTDVYTGVERIEEKEEPQEDVRANVPIALQKRGESKSKRLQLLIRPSVHEKLVRIAKEYGTSVNDVINQVLEGFVGE